jgi:hypothetical protein
VSSLFCRHNRFTADCPICSKGTVLDPARAADRPRPARRPAAPGRKGGARGAPAPDFAGPYVSAGPYERGDGTTFEVRLERVPGGVRVASWSGGRLERRAPELRESDIRTLVAAALERELLAEGDLRLLSGAVAVDADAAAGAAATAGAETGANGDAPAASPGRAGDMREELRVEPRGEGMVRVARWLHYPSRGWELQDAPTMLPVARYAEALRAFFARPGRRA